MLELVENWSLTRWLGNRKSLRNELPSRRLWTFCTFDKLGRWKNRLSQSSEIFMRSFDREVSYKSRIQMYTFSKRHPIAAASTSTYIFVESSCGIRTLKEITDWCFNRCFIGYLYLVDLA